MKSLSVQLTGIRPLVMHNGDLADRINKYTIAIKEITSKGGKKMTETDFANRDRLEWEGSLYWDDKDGPIIPSDNIERCIQFGARKQRLGRDVEAAVFCSTSHAKLGYDGPRDKDALYKSGRFTLRKGVVVGESRIIRVRPMFPTGWVLRFEIEFDDSIVDEQKLARAISDAGALVGIGDNRPKFGRFIVEVK